MRKIVAVKVLLVLSIVVPVSLLTALELKSSTQELTTTPRIITTTAETVDWNMSRPSYFFSIDENITSAYADGDFLGSLTIYPTSYCENDGMLDYNDGLWLRLTANANTNVGFIYSMNIKSSETDEYAVLDFVEGFYNWRELTNLAQWRISDGSHSKGALFETLGIGQPKECTLKLKSLWKFFDLNDVDHWIIIMLEIVRFNGTTYHQVSIPIRLGVIASDNNDSFDAAVEIQLGTYSMLYLGSYDTEDYYKIHLTQGQRIDVCVNTTPFRPENLSPDLQLYLYDPARELKAVPADQSNYYKAISFIADSTGYWYIEARRHVSHGFYSMTVSVQK